MIKKKNKKNDVQSISFISYPLPSPGTLWSWVEPELTFLKTDNHIP